jgi:hypothetical protein
MWNHCYSKFGPSVKTFIFQLVLSLNYNFVAYQQKKYQQKNQQKYQQKSYKFKAHSIAFILEIISLNLNIYESAKTNSRMSSL